MILLDYPEVSRWVADRASCEIPKIGAAIGWLRDDELTCGVMFEHFTGRSITATIAIEPGAVMTKTFLFTIFDYPFNQLDVEKIICYIEQSNAPSVRLVEKLGFTLEATITDMFEGGDGLIYTMRKADCRWLEMIHGQEN